MPNRSYVLVLNWNGWADTLTCLESLLHSRGFDARIVVWDNGSTDDSVERITAWARGELDVLPSIPRTLHDRVRPPTPKPLAFATREPQEADAGEPLVLIRGDRNLGYAGGNNAAMRWALARPDCGWLWILNNDIVVDAQAGAELLAAVRNDPYDRPAGSFIFHLDEPERLQACGGQRLGRGPLLAPRYVDRIESVDYLTGASLFMSRRRAQQLGLFNEDYFLNAEDLEYTYAYGRRFARAHPGVPPFLVAGRVWHRESSSQARNRYLHTYYYTRNLLYAARRIGPIHGVATLAAALARVGLALLRGEPQAARGIARGIRDYRAGVVGAWQQRP
ncbi:glycosyltransferase family 2 protein [Sinimarinibacterium thermocellulolyticum]|uniref:Glycosyltransferase family 2 protein n=1 Tax=Sinimarinibacterium thermocellulolyticum TaxID=3170016 RepID=A0ABV2A9U1_9GAMM